MKSRVQNQDQALQPAPVLKTFILFTFIALFGIGCQQQSPPNLEVMWVRDLSESVDSAAHPDSQEDFEYLLKQLGLDKTDHYVGHGIKVHFSYVGNNSRPDVTTVTLEPGGLWLLTNGKRRGEEVRQFIGDLREAYDNWLNLEATHQTSLIYCGMAYHMRLLKESTFAPEKTYTIYSDGFEASDVTRFKAYKDNPEKLRNMLPAIAQKLQEQCPLPDSIGAIHVKMINPPTPETDELTRVTDQFWQDLYANKGVYIKIRSDVND